MYIYPDQYKIPRRRLNGRKGGREGPRKICKVKVNLKKRMEKESPD
jgi:hypothetical protein